MGERWTDRLRSTSVTIILFTIILVGVVMAAHTVQNARWYKKAVRDGTKGCTMSAARVLLKKLQPLCLYASSLVIFVSYPSLCRNLIEILNCERFMSNTASVGSAAQFTSYLYIDRTVRCDDLDQGYASTKTVSLVGFVIVMFGMPLMLLVLLREALFPINRLYAADEHGAPVPNEDVVGPRVGIYKAYIPSCWATEPFEMARKLVLVALIKRLLPQSQKDMSSELDGTESRLLFIAGIICLVAATCFTAYRPYRSNAGNRCQIMTQICLCYLFFDGTNLIYAADEVAAPTAQVSVCLLIVGVCIGEVYWSCCCSGGGGSTAGLR